MNSPMPSSRALILYSLCELFSKHIQHDMPQYKIIPDEVNNYIVANKPSNKTDVQLRNAVKHLVRI